MSTLARDPGAAGSWHFDTGHAILLAAAVLAVLTAYLPSGLMRPPGWMVFPFADWINWLFVFVKDDLGSRSIPIIGFLFEIGDTLIFHLVRR